MRPYVLMFVSIMTLVGCSPKVHHEGKNIEQSDLEQIKVNQHTKQDVLNLLGSPSMQSMYADDRWYYYSKLTETTAFLKPVAAEQNVHVISFDKSGTVTSVKHLDLDNSQSVAYVKRETPTTGQDTSMLQQLFGNFGRISRSDKMEK